MWDMMITRHYKFFLKDDEVITIHNIVKELVIRKLANKLEFLCTNEVKQNVGEPNHYDADTMINSMQEGEVMSII